MQSLLTPTALAASYCPDTLPEPVSLAEAHALLDRLQPPFRADAIEALVMLAHLQCAGDHRHPEVALGWPPDEPEDADPEATLTAERALLDAPFAGWDGEWAA